MKRMWAALTRRKTDDAEETESKLARVLNLFDLTALGVGSTLGLGVYVLAGSVAYNKAGPAVTLSFFVAAVASAFAGICYAEFAARVPRAGSAYVYSYVTIGEFVAFTIGWNLILEYVLGTASVARGLSTYFDSLLGYQMSKVLGDAVPINVNFLGTYPDFLAFGMVILLTCVLSFGVKESSLLNNIFTSVNMLTICVVIVAGAIKANPDNWFIPSDQVPDGFGTGGFMPYGFMGVMAGAAKCFFGFVGFDCIATTGEEAINPKRNIPLAIVISLIIIFLSYFGVSTVLTMMLPYFEQDTGAPFPKAFESVGWIAIKWIVTIGAVFALCTSLLGAMFPLPRVLYAMGNDGILFKKLALVNDRTQTPLIATIVSGAFASMMALMFDLDQLIDMMSIGTLLAYTIVAICVLILRYQDDISIDSSTSTTITTTTYTSRKDILKQLFNCNRYRTPTALSSSITKIGVICYAFICLMFCSFDKIFESDTITSQICLTITAVILIFLLIIIAMQPVSAIELTFKVPFVPFVPGLSIFANLYLMFQLDVFTWIRFLIWVIFGYFIYFSYGIRTSTQGVRNRKQKETKLSNSVNFKYYENNSFEQDSKVDIKVLEKA